MEANASMVLYEFFHFLIGFSLGNCEFARVCTRVQTYVGSICSRLR